MSPQLKRRIYCALSYYKLVFPIKYLSHSRAAPRPSVIAQATKLWPLLASPAVNILDAFVTNFPNSALTLLLSSVSTPSCFNKLSSGPKNPIHISTNPADHVFSVPAISTGPNLPLISFFHSISTVSTAFIFPS